MKKTTNTSDNVIFIYDAAGRLIEERNSSNGALQTSYVYAGGRLLSTETSSATTYLTTDHLGSPRINTDGSGNVVARHDYHPFGEEIDGTGGRTTGLGYPSGSDGIRQQFTGYERDTETDLDFAEARYYNPVHGRFTSIDPLLTTGRPFNPQTWNRYSYVLNNPLNLTDPTGEDYEDLSDRQKKLINDWALMQNVNNKTDISAEEQYDALEESQRATFEAVANTLENITIIGADGSEVNGLDIIQSINFIAGSIPGKSGSEQFRVFFSITEENAKLVENAKNFKPVRGHQGFPISRQLKGGEPSPQISISEDRKSAEADIDFESKHPLVVAFTLCQLHCKPGNSDPRGKKNFKKLNKKFGNGSAGPLKRQY